MNPEKKTVISLIPNIKITENKNVLKGNITKENITVFSGNFSIDENNCNLEETFEIPIKEFVFNKKDHIYSLNINVPSQLTPTIKNIGLFLKKSQDSDKNILIAYASLDESIDATKNLTLHLSVPPFNKSDQNNPTTLKNLPTNTQEPVAIEILRSYWKKKMFGWHEEYIGQEELKTGRFFINAKMANIAVAHNGNSSLYLLYQSENGGSVYMNIYEFSREKTIPTRLTTTLNNWQGGVRNAIFTDTRNKEKVRCFLSHSQGVYCIDISLRDLSGSHQEVYSPSARVSKSTLVNFGGHPYLVGGNLGSIADGRHVAATGIIGTTPITPVWRIWKQTYNPIVEYFNNNMHFIGGNFNSYEEAVEIKPSPVPSNKNFLNANNIRFYDSIFPKPSNNNQLINVNSVSHAHCRVNNKIYIFPRNLFQQRNSPFYIYDTAANSVSKEQTPVEIVDKVQKQNLRDYQTLQVVAISNTIFFVLTKSSYTSLDTQILYWETI